MSKLAGEILNALDKGRHERAVDPVGSGELTEEARQGDLRLIDEKLSGVRRIVFDNFTIEEFTAAKDSLKVD